MILGIRTSGLGAFLSLALTAAAGVTAWTADARAAESYSVEVAEFVVSLVDGAGNERTVTSDVVPYLPDQACFGWRIRLAVHPAVLKVREVLHLPKAPATWSGEDDAYSLHSFSADRRTATTEEYKVPRDGWLDNHWCIVEGDPLGPHWIEVYIEDELIKHFDFEVKKPSEIRNN